MKQTLAWSLGFLTIVSAAGWAGTSPENANFWPQWRGPNATGVANDANPPTRWSESENVRWKVEVPGKGSASPIVWGEKVFVLSAVPTGPEIAPDPPTQPEATTARPGRGRRRGPRGIRPTRVQQFTILAYNRQDGKILWQRVLREKLPHEGTHPTGTWASASPVTDGEHVYAFFGSQGLYCLTMDGKPVWDKDLGDMTIRLGFGEGSSPVLEDDRIIVNWDHQGQSFIVALDKKTGRELWRADRDEITSWSTPLVVEHDGRKQVITNATNRVRSYDFASGQLLWESEGMTTNTIPTPVSSQGIVFVTSGFRGNALLAIRLDKAAGNITGSEAIVWSHDRDTPYTPSPLLYGDGLYFLKRNNGVLTRFNAMTGEMQYGPLRLDDVPNVYASPVGAADRIYIAGREGTTLVIEHGPEFNVLSVNTLDDGFDASPAIVDKEIYLRGQRYLYRISE